LIFALTVQLAFRTADAVLVDSDASAADLDQLWPRPKIEPIIVPGAPDPSFCPQSAARIDALRTKLSLPKQYVLYLGSNKPHKNLTRLVDAWGRLPTPPMPLLIAGFWDERFPEARHLAEQLANGDSIRFLGPIEEDDMPALYSGAYCFVFPSEYEGCGLPVLEAMACGTAVACSNRSSLPEVAGEAALLFDPDDIHAIAAALHRFLTEPDLIATYKEKSGRQASRFTWTAAAEKTLSLYRRYAA
jgi:alpha-1,3-rhamnosyl/mannosyltransferase